ncbi:MAG: winged helix-turn-helix transcriptional regulator [Verrucomicrobia bacterium]|nr:winged helix-turn-helix transcriptional regulator [Verrucomicrobiota bacterium]
MADLQEPVSLPPKTQLLDENVVFSILGDPLRRKLLMVLARKSAQPAADLHKTHQLCSTVKHLAVMRSAGFVIMAANPADGRRALYSLSPAISAVVSECSVAFHFCFQSFSAEVSIGASVSPTKHQWNEDFVFDTLAEPVRRRLLLALARGGPQPAVNLQGAGGRTIDDTLKRLARMRTAGLVTMSDNQKDGRRNLYSLSPQVPLTTDGASKVIDFGFCVLRLG